jgi:Uma2 family endonuclease
MIDRREPTMPRTITPRGFETLAEVFERIGDVPPERIRMNPPPGTATEQDVLDALEAADKRLYELVDGVLVEKAVGTKEGLLAGLILGMIFRYLEENNIGHVLPGDGALRLMKGLIRYPDVAFIRWERMPDGFPEEPIATLVPHLAVEVISQSNTPGEMKRKLKDYFFSGVELVWFVYPKTQTAEVYTAPDRKKRIGKGGTLDGGSLLPGFQLSLPDLFARAARKPKKP